MILNKEKTKCETNMTGGTAFTIAANAKMFKILSNSLYSNKERAIIREVSCNAYDANVDAGNGHLPIVVHLPNILEPFFSIKDSGTGLTPDQMASIYTQYGNSTKTDNNEAIGCLGFGSKSPFAYINSFSVISITSGVKSTYSCYIDGDGNPQLQPFSTEETDEINGVEVTFPVKQEDFSKFCKEAEIVYRPFEVQPDVKGNSDYKVKSFKVLLASENKEWQIVEPVNKINMYNKIQVAVQGNIEYPINNDKIYDVLSDRAKIFINENYRLYFNIGELDIAASREELGYDKETIANIAEKFEVMASEIEERQHAKIEKFKTKYEAMEYITNLVNSSPLYRNFKFTYRGEEITNSVELDSNTFLVKYLRNNKGISRKVLNTRENSSLYYTIPGSNVIYVLNDDNKKINAVSKARSLVKYDTSVILVDSIETIEKLGNPKYLNTSEIELVKNSNKINSGNFFKNYYHSFNYKNQWCISYRNISDIDLDITKPFYYMEIKGGYSALGIDIYDYVTLAKKLGLIEEDIRIIGVSSTHVKSKLFRTYDAIEFSSFVINVIKNSIYFKTKISELGTFDKFNKINSMNYRYIELINDSSFMNDMCAESPFRTIYKDYKEAQKSLLEDDNVLSNLLKKVANTLDIEIPNSDYTLHEEIVKTYPLINDLSWDFNKKEVSRYVQGLDLLIAHEKNSIVANLDEEIVTIENTQKINNYLN